MESFFKCMPSTPSDSQTAKRKAKAIESKKAAGALKNKKAKVTPAKKGKKGAF
jgi:hypothetical protein